MISSKIDKMPAFPLVRHLSKMTTPVLLRLPVSANQVTAVSLVMGLGGCWFISHGGYDWILVGALLFVGCYILDNCDGEVARAKNQCSTFGEKFDTFVDWIVHSLFFVALGMGIKAELGDDFWLWLGYVGAAGGTINYFIGLVMDYRFRKEDADAPTSADGPVSEHKKPENWKQWILFAFRELSRADFCFIVLVLALFDATWVLLPTAAVGAHAYWLTQFIRSARDYHV